ncbi:MAG TPA: outer membrane protein transport protein [Melioribacteraceae bacterium]|nr:outer membrane protein transport protein [Melioribacteraceae bacterium]
MHNKVLYLLSFIIFISLNIMAQGISDVVRLSEPGLGSGARTIGMGNSFTSVADDFSAVFSNPAGLGLIKRFELSTGFDFNKVNNNTTFLNNSTDFSQNNANFSQLGFVYPFPTIQGSLSFAAGLTKQKDFNKIVKYTGFNPYNTSMIQDLTSKTDDIPYDLGLSYPVYNNQNQYLYDETLINGNLNQSAEIIQTGSLNRYSFAGAIEFAKNVFVGLSLNFLGGTFNQTKDYYEDDTKDVYNNSIETYPGDPTTRSFEYFNLKDEIDWELSGYSFNMGLLYEFKDRIRVGLNIKFPDVITVKEKYTVDASARFGNKTYFIEEPVSSKIEYEISTPFEFTTGLAYTAYNWIISAQATLIDYSQAEFSDGLNEGLRAKNNSNIKKDLVAVVNYNLGAEYNFVPLNLRVRAGYMQMPSAFKSDKSSKFTKKFYTFGLGYILEQSVAIDAAYVYGTWNDIGYAYSTDTIGYQQKIDYNNFILTISYRF